MKVEAEVGEWLPQYDATITEREAAGGRAAMSRLPPPLLRASFGLKRVQVTLASSQSLYLWLTVKRALEEKMWKSP